jgi:hypothetical protein
VRALPARFVENSEQRIAVNLSLIKKKFLAVNNGRAECEESRSGKYDSSQVEVAVAFCAASQSKLLVDAAADHRLEILLFLLASFMLLLFILSPLLPRSRR